MSHSALKVNIYESLFLGGRDHSYREKITVRKFVIKSIYNNTNHI